MPFFRKKSEEQFFVGLDICTSMVRLAVGQITAGSGSTPRSQLQIIGAAAVPTDGVQRGVVTSIEELISSLSSALEQGERMAGFPI